MKQPLNKQYLDVELQADQIIITPIVTDMRDANKCLQIRENFVELARQRQLENVVLDLSRVVHMGSLGVRSLVSLLRAVCENQGRLVVCGLNGELRGLLYVCSLITEDRNNPGPMQVADDRRQACELLSTSVS